ncbi:hypothetical protein KKG29_02520 [Patescibacteria group bacterium]|nr:hypothetical protein [Patescibacteria group bacterium]MBU4000029.1 hypothetical protein [Patescibacteria group bacterium]MBU4056866.1 hypothetical protein [Patescibacteria group bacterium]MBU4368924.1 hypothetical protein [Patescibacteria group bacterium]
MTTILQENIITKLGLAGLSIDKQADLLMRMAKIIQERIALRVVKLLPEAALDEYLKLADNDEIGANQFLSQKLPNYASIIEEEINKFKQEIIS